MAKQLAQLLEPHRPLFIEEPLLPGHINELKDLYNKTTIPIAVSTLPAAPSEADS
jgi:galactonate dehydratase